MNSNSSTNTNFRCGEIFQRQNEFIMICVLCNKEFCSYRIFTNHIIKKSCLPNDTPLLQQTLKIEKDIIDDLLIQPKTEPPDSGNKNELVNKVTPKIEHIEIQDYNSQNKQIDVRKSSNKNITINKVSSESTNISRTKPLKRIVKKKIIWDPDDPKIQLLCENYQNKSPKYRNKNCKDIVKTPTQPIKQIKPLANQSETTNLCNRKPVLVKTFQKQSRIGNTPRKSEKTTQKKIKRIKKVIWDPDAPDEQGLYKSKTNVDSNNLEGIKLPSHAI